MSLAVISIGSRSVSLVCGSRSQHLFTDISVFQFFSLVRNFKVAWRVIHVTGRKYINLCSNSVSVGTGSISFHSVNLSYCK